MIDYHQALTHPVADEPAALEAYDGMPVHLYDKATWLTSPGTGWESTVTDVMSRHAVYADLPMIDRWSVYQHDGQWFAINLDGTLRSTRSIAR